MTVRAPISICHETLAATRTFGLVVTPVPVLTQVLVVLVRNSSGLGSGKIRNQTANGNCANTRRRTRTRTRTRIRNGIPALATALTLEIIILLVLAQVRALVRSCTRLTTVALVHVAGRKSDYNSHRSQAQNAYYNMIAKLGLPYWPATNTSVAIVNRIILRRVTIRRQSQ